MPSEPAPHNSHRSPTLRPSARVLLIDDSDRILLFRVSLPHRPNIRLWITPGGGLDEGETHEQAALRELYEETGLCGVKLGQWIWNRRHIWQWGNIWNESVERFYLLRVPAFTAAPTALDEWEKQHMHEHRWWSLADIIAANASEIFVPRRIHELLPPIIAGNLPPQPVDVGA